MTVIPLLLGVQDWLPPARTADIFGKTHFAARAVERGVRSIPGHLLLWIIKEAIHLGRADLVSPVYALCDESTLYRVILPEGQFYPVVKDGAPVTIYSATEKRKLQRSRRLRKRHTGARARR